MSSPASGTRDVSPIGATNAALKRSFDVLLAIAGLASVWWLIALGYLLARLSTGGGLFRQVRTGLHGEPFTILKLQTMAPRSAPDSGQTVAGDTRVTPVGRFLRATRMDELPQLWNVLRGDMSFVGPRPDLAEMTDLLEGEDRLMLAIRPGITGPATLHYRDEESLLAEAEDPDEMARDVIWPDKVRRNLRYIREYSLLRDLWYILLTLVPGRKLP